ncbi:MAG: excinuclease ABC subunit UvrC [Fastidiosipilaceae bacterium]
MPEEKLPRKTFEARLDLVPTSPGVYLMKNASGSVIYVGKAINLRSRLRSYFGANPAGNQKVMAMIAQIHDFSYLVVNNELEALILESNLIKRYQPFYNILLKDDHDYPYLRITMNELYPRALKAYRVGPDVEEGAKYYGPYQAGDLYRALRTLQALFPIKDCRRVLPRDIGKERECLNYHIHRCIGPCRGDVSAEDYRAVMQSVCDFLEGRYTGLLQDLRERMMRASDRQDFETAAVFRDRLRSLEKLMEEQVAVSDRRFDSDALGVWRSGLEICVLKLEVRGGKITGTSTFFLSAEGESESDALLAFVEQHYPNAAFIPPEILTDYSTDSDEWRSAAETLTQLRGAKLVFHTPQRGTKRKILDMAVRNAKEAIRRRDIMRGSSRTAVDAALRMLAVLTGMDKGPAKIEAYDISNAGPEDQACGMVVFTDGTAQRGQYKRFKIKEADGQDDYRAMSEAIGRRMARVDDPSFGPLPDLILVDGGLAHVSVIRTLLDELDHKSIKVAGMIKDGRHRTRGLALADGTVAELAQNLGLARGSFAKDNTQPEALDQYDREEQLNLLRFLTAVQDEAHRFAARYTATLSKNRKLKYNLESIPGVGPATRKRLMSAFRTIKAISKASVEELMEQVPRLGEKTAKSIYRHFHTDK